MAQIFTDAERREIAGRARPLHERLNGPPNEKEVKPPIDPDRIIEEWKDQFPSEEAFDARLEKEGLSLSNVRQQVGATRFPVDEPLPEWIFSLEALVAFLESAGNGGDEGESRTDTEPRPFTELLTPVADYAQEQLPSTSIDESALSPFVAGLREQMDILCVQALYVEFKSFIQHFDPDLVDAEPTDFDEPPTEYYERFISAMFEHGFRNLCLEYPVLLRQLDQLITNWVNAVTEVCQRVQADRNALKERFAVSGDIIELEPLSDDAHDGGRLPVRVSFETGSVIYKPRPVDSGITFYAILTRLETHLSVPSIEPPTYLPRDGYGWMEEIEYDDLSDPGGADRYYERAGAILCVGYILNFTDCQLENIIVAGETPMIIDGETIFHPSVPAAEMPAQTEIAQFLKRSVLLTALVPWSSGNPQVPDKKGFAASLAGLGSKSGQTELPSRKRPVIEAVNTDVMTVSKEPISLGLATNTPSIGETDYPPDEHIESIIRGFKQAYEAVETLHAADRFVPEIIDDSAVRGLENRLVFRTTMAYATVLQSAVSRNPLRDGAQLTVEFESLAAAFFDGQIATDSYWELYEAERRALLNRDIPRFTSRTDGKEIFQNERKLGPTVEQSGYDQFLNRLEEMDGADMERQCWLLKSAFDVIEPRYELPPAAEVSNERLQAEAVELFDITNDARIATETADSWVSLTPNYDGVNLYPADSTLFWGRGGIALTAAALATATGQDRYRQHVDEILEPVVTSIHEDTFSAGLGGIRGVGSVIYSLSVIAELLAEERYAESAARATTLVTDERIAADETLEVMQGSAGTLLALLAHYDRYGGEAVRERAVACGERLLETRSQLNGHRVWVTEDESPLVTGFSHGTSGIAYALARLASVTGDERYAKATREALAFESSLYDSSKLNWPSTTAETEYVDRWCHGRTGMALARIGIADALEDPDLRAEAATSLSVTGTGTPSHLDNVCCGNAGRVDALLVGSRRAGLDRTYATELAGRFLARRAEDGTLSLPGHSQWFGNPTFFDGVSGVAYTLLRLRDPDALPCVLLLE